MKKLLKLWQFKQSINPVGSFDQLESPAAPDYHNLDHWAAHPNKNDKSNYYPTQLETPDNEPLADVFFLHPTTFFGNQHWNAPLDHQVSREAVNELIVPGQASVFNNCCRIYMPRYRQATFHSFLFSGKNGEKAWDLAYQDIENAFLHYLEHWNDGRPFFIAGHSQGALHSMRLLETQIEGKELFNQFVAAYPIGFRFPKDKFERSLKQIKPAHHPDQTGCVATFDTYLELGSPSNLLEGRKHWYPTKDGKGKWESAMFKKPFGINPVTWSIDDVDATVNAKRHIGGSVVHFEGNRPKPDVMWAKEPSGIDCTSMTDLFPEQVNTTLKKDGFLYVSSPKERLLKRMLLPGGNLHLYDYAIFYADIRANVRVRLNSFLKTVKRVK